MTRPDTGQLAFEHMQADIRRARAATGRDPREPMSGNATRPTGSAGRPADPMPSGEPAADAEEREAMFSMDAENPAQIRREPGTNGPSTRPEQPDPEAGVCLKAMEKNEAHRPKLSDAGQLSEFNEALERTEPTEPDPLDEAEHAEDHPTQDDVPWP